MANILKFKLSLITFSISVLILIPLFKSNFNAPPTIKKWQQLGWDDFQGFVKPFTGWGAGISSNVYLEFDSLSKTYVSYAGQNNQQSWVKDNSIKSDYLLNHEQYHFNITEFHSRLMSAYLQNNPENIESDHLEKLASIRADLFSMQAEYDNESDHGINRDWQRRWEYKIDSLLLEYSDDSVMVTDYYSGARIFFPVAPTFIHGTHKDQSAYRIYQLEKYDMSLAITSFQYEESFEKEFLEGSLSEYYATDSLEILSFEIDTSKFEYKASIEAFDSLALENYHHLWVYEKGYLYKLTVTYPAYYGGVEGYKEVALSFINSFEIINTNDFWILRFDNSSLKITYSNIERGIKENEPGFSSCVTYGQPSRYGFYRGPFYRKDGGLILAYDIIDHADSLLYENILIIDNELYTYEPDSVDHLFFIPSNYLPDKPFQIDFGYLLAEDTTEQCFEFYYQSIMVNSADNN